GTHSAQAHNAVGESLRRNRLQQIIQRVNFEGSSRVVAVCGNKNDNRPAVLWQRIEDTESVEAWHLNIEKHDVRLCFLDHLHSRRTVAGFAGNFDFIAVRREQARETVARFTFIVDDERAAFQERTPRGCGRISVARVPPESMSSSLSIAVSP